MTVRELVDELRKYPDDAMVLPEYSDCRGADSSFVYVQGSDTKHPEQSRLVRITRVRY